MGSKKKASKKKVTKKVKKADKDVSMKAARLIAQAASLLGWEVCFRKGSGDVDYIVVGTHKQVIRISELIDGDDAK